MAHTERLQQEIDARIAELESEILDLKRRRNELSPISQIPPEIFCEILELATTASEGGASIFQLRTGGHIRTLCHVSRDWRSLALTCPQLWAGIDVRNTSNAAQIEFLINHAHPQPLSLCIEESSQLARQVRPMATGSEIGFNGIKEILLTRGFSVRKLAFSGRTRFLKDYLAVAPTNSALHTIRVHNAERPLGPSRLWVATTAVFTPQCALVSSKSPELRVLDLLDSAIPLTSPVLFSPALIDLYLSIPPGSTVRELLGVLQSASRLQHMNLEFPHDFQPPESSRPYSVARLSQLCAMVITGKATSILALLQQLSLPAMVLQTMLSCTVPSQARAQIVGEAVLAALAKARLPSLKGLPDQHRYLSPHAFKIDTRGAESVAAVIGHCLFQMECRETPFDRPWGNLISATSASVGMLVEGTSDALAFQEWLPMCHPPQQGDTLRSIGWTFDHLLCLHVDYLQDTYPSSSFWETISNVPGLQQINIGSHHASEFLPFLFSGCRDSLGKAVRLPFPRLYQFALRLQPADQDFEGVIKAIVGAFEKRRRLAMECYGEATGLGTLDTLIFMDCNAPPVQSLLDSIPQSLVTNVHCEAE